MATISTIVILFALPFLTAAKTESCPIWHVPQQNGACACGSNLGGVIQKCEDDSLTMSTIFCLTWDDETDAVWATYCLNSPGNKCRGQRLDGRPYRFQYHYNVPTQLSGQELNQFTCRGLNREGVLCKKCISGYGPAAFSYGISCADCSKSKHMWILNLLLQLLLLSAMFVLIIIFKLKVTSCPLNIIITYSQLVINAIMYNIEIRIQIEKMFGQKASTVLLTILGISNLDFLYLVIPPFCISPSMKQIHVFFFDYIIALYPVVMTVVVYSLIELHDRDCRIVVILCSPLRRLNRCFRGSPKQSIVNAFVTFLLLSYSKLLFVSSKFLFAVQSYDSQGHLIPNTTVLLYDPNVEFFKTNHIPYVIISLFVLVTFVFLPPLCLLLFPTRFFRKMFTMCGFRRWDIIHMIMDTFQGWYKDGTDGTRDFRPLSALYMLLRIGLVGEFLTVIHLSVHSVGVKKWFVTAVVHILLGVMHYAAKPYKKQWMNIVDGSILFLLGIVFLL